MRPKPSRCAWLLFKAEAICDGQRRPPVRRTKGAFDFARPGGVVASTETAVLENDSKNACLTDDLATKSIVRVSLEVTSICHSEKDGLTNNFIITTTDFDEVQSPT